MGRTHACRGLANFNPGRAARLASRIRAKPVGNESTTAHRRLVARVVREALQRGASVQIDGLGTFRADSPDSFHFVPQRAIKVFIGYVHEDAEVVSRLFDELLQRGFEPWMDRRKLLPGQNWPRAIENALESADFAITCFSCQAVNKRGGFQAEIRYALECARRMPLDDVFLVPVRLDACRVPARVAREVQYIDLFPDWNQGLRRLIRTLKSKRREQIAA